MDQIITSTITQLGAVGILVAFLMWLIVRYEKRMTQIHLNHVKEREAWMLQAATQHNDIVLIAKESNTLLAELKTILGQRQR